MENQPPEPNPKLTISGEDERGFIRMDALGRGISIDREARKQIEFLKQAVNKLLILNIKLLERRDR